MTNNQDFISIKGARQHNLANIDVDIPKNKFVVITGVSGSGKSSLAFDTIYAEGQRRYVESLSSYARQFLGLMSKPEVDEITGLSPSISIDQKTATHNPRSTVGTITEIYDYLRVLYARIGHPHCPICGEEITKLSLDEIVDKIINFIDNTVTATKSVPHTFDILSPIVRNRKGEYRDLLNNLISKGFSKAMIDNKKYDLTDEIVLIKTNKHTISAYIDTISATHKDMKDDIFRANMRTRLNQAIEQSVNLSDGLVSVISGKTEHLYSERFSCPNDNTILEELEPRMFSFNSPIGACITCKGLGYVQKIDPERVINPKFSVNEGAILPYNRLFFHDTWFTRLLAEVAKQEGLSLTKPLSKFSKKEKDLLFYGTGKTYHVIGTNRHGNRTSIKEEFNGVITRLEQQYFNSGGENHHLSQYMKEEVCQSCAGKKLKPEVLGVTIDNFNIAEITELPITDLQKYVKNDLEKRLSDYEVNIATGIIKEITTRLTFLNNVGLGYLDLSRRAKTLSGGEQQRIRLASQIGTGLTGVLYVLDEPSIGLHARDVSALIESLQKLVDLGNTLLVVEHDQETIESAEYIVELGPYAGKHGGKLIAQGSLKEIKNSKNSLTGQYLSGKKTIPKIERSLVTQRGSLNLIGASQNNLKNINVELPLNNLIGITGVSGSGKSTLITETLYPALQYYVAGKYQDHMGQYKRIDGYQNVDNVYLVDQTPIGRTPRSNPATYVGFFNDIRDLYASTEEARFRGYKKGRFSFNVKGGRCEKCQGGGVIKIEMQFMSDVYVKCDVCNGKRYNQETLEVKYKGETIYDILKMTMEEGAEFFHNHPKINSKLTLLNEVGLGYLTIGQPAPTLSGGEAQRIKLANELTKRQTGNTVYILDEPTTGLHFHDIKNLLQTLHRLVDQGNTVIIIEHNLDVIKNCDWIIDLGPEGGDEGGHVVYQGPTDKIIKEKNSYTAKYLAKHL